LGGGGGKLINSHTVKFVVLRSAGMFTVMNVKMTVVWDVKLRNHLSRSWKQHVPPRRW
jgi:hypothetical protein